MKLCNKKKLLKCKDLNPCYLAMGILCLLVLALVIAGILDMKAGFNRVFEKEKAELVNRML